MTDDTEEWRPVVGFEGLYEVSPSGRVRGLPRLDARGRNWPGKVLEERRDKDGYLKVTLHRDARRHERRVHRLVLEAFVGPSPPNKPWALHGPNGITDNTPGNLYWGSPTRNTLDRKRDGTCNSQLITSCVNGHQYTEENTYRNPKTGARACATCRYKYAAEGNAKRAQARMANREGDKNGNG